jgi:segregation and condensation protein A
MEDKINLEHLVAQPTWREMLLDLVASEKLDPWNIDIVDIAERYLTRIRSLQMIDLHVPANLILAASILLRFKSDALKFEEEEQVVEQEVFIEEQKVPVEIPMLSLRTRIPPKRKVTLDELVTALEEVFEEQKTREEKPILKESLIINLPKYDISERMNLIFKKVKELADKKGLVTFSSLLKEKTRSEIIFTLLPILHLAQDEKITIFQEKFFGEIFIQLKGRENAGA